MNITKKLLCPKTTSHPSKYCDIYDYAEGVSIHYLDCLSALRAKYIPWEAEWWNFSHNIIFQLFKKDV